MAVKQCDGANMARQGRRTARDEHLKLIKKIDFAELNVCVCRSNTNYFVEKYEKCTEPF